MHKYVLILSLCAVTLVLLIGALHVNAEVASEPALRVPLPPAGLQAFYNRKTMSREEYFTLIWKAQSPRVDYYVIECRVPVFPPGRPYGQWRQLGTSRTTSFTHGNFIENSNLLVYSYRVKACNAEGCSPSSEPTTITIHFSRTQTGR